jgi:predicted dehydrogenase
VIANPTALHAETAVCALDAGADVFIEKPVAHTLDGCKELEDRVARCDQLSFVGFQYRFHPGLRQTREWLRDGAIGRPVSARAHYGEYLPGWHPQEDYRLGYSAREDLGGGVIHTLCHPLDYLMWLLGPVRSVAAAAGKLSDLDLDVEDTASMTLRFESGAVGTLCLDYVQRPRSHRFTIVGTRGTITWDERDGTARMYDAAKESWQHHSPPDSFNRNDMFLAEMKHFLRCIDVRTEPFCTISDGARVLEVAVAAHTSSRSGRFVDV